MFWRKRFSWQWISYFSKLWLSMIAIFMENQHFFFRQINVFTNEVSEELISRIFHKKIWFHGSFVIFTLKRSIAHFQIKYIMYCITYPSVGTSDCFKSHDGIIVWRYSYVSMVAGASLKLYLGKFLNCFINSIVLKFLWLRPLANLMTFMMASKLWPIFSVNEWQQGGPDVAVQGCEDSKIYNLRWKGDITCTYLQC